MSDEEKLVSHYRLKTLLRRDGFGAVYLGEDTRDQKECVLRIIELDHPTLARITGRVRARSQRDHPLIEQIRQRMKRISELKNPHVLPVIEFGEEHIQGNNDIIFYMVSPYEKMSLLSYWSEHTSSAELISLEVIADLIVQAAEALFYVHRRGLVHQYVRLSSFMLRSTTRGRRHLHLLLTDFWFADITAAILEEGQIAQDLSVYLAPEQLTGKALAASDQYTLAILAYELLLGHRLAQVDLSLGLYERFVRQRGSEGSRADLELARRLDLVLTRALAENAAARFATVEEFAETFRAVARGEEVDLLALEEDTARLPAAASSGRGESQSGAAFIAAAAGTVAAGEIVEELAESQNGTELSEQGQSKHHPGLRKTVLTSAGMETTEVIAEEELVGGVSQADQARQSSTLLTAETHAVIEEEHTQPSAAMTGFAAGQAAGAALQQEVDISAEQTRIVENGSAAFSAGEAAQREADISAEQTQIAESNSAAFAAGLAAGESAQREADIAAEQTQITGNSAAAFAAGLVVGGAFQQEIDISEERTQIIGGTAGGAIAAGSIAGESTAPQQETDISEERTQIIGGTAAGVFAAGAAGLVAGGLLASGIETAQDTASAAGGAGMGVLEASGSAGGTAGLAIGATLASASGSTTGAAQQAGRVAAGSAGAGLAAGIAGTSTNGSAAGMSEATQQAGGAGLAAGEAAGGASAGVVGTGLAAGTAGGYAAGEIQQAGGAAVGSASAGMTTGAAGTAGGSTAEATLAASGVAAGTTQQVGGAGLMGAGLAAGSAAGGVVTGTAQQAGGIGGGIAGGTSRRKSRGSRVRPLLAAIVIALLLVVIAGGVFVAFAANQSSSAMVTLTLKSRTFQNTYVLTAVTGTTTSGQIQASLLTRSASQSKTGRASGYYSGTHASGFITFTNSSTGCGCPIFIPAGTAFTGASGVTVVTDTGASVASLCTVTVRAHALIIGPAGDIPAGNVQARLSSNSHISATNRYAFSGGQNGQSNALIQQSDINRLASSLKAQVQQSAQAGLEAQVKSTQHLFAAPVCRSKTSSNRAAGDFASDFTVTVTSTCTAEAYDYSTAVQIIQQQVQTETSTYLSSEFVLVGGLQTTVTSATLTDAHAGTLLLAIKTVGKWAYKLSSQQEGTWARLIAGKSASVARSFLSGEDGVAAVNISISGRDQNTLPSDASKITIVLRS